MVLCGKVAGDTREFEILLPKSFAAILGVLFHDFPFSFIQFAARQLKGPGRRAFIAEVAEAPLSLGLYRLPSHCQSRLFFSWW